MARGVTLYKEEYCERLIDWMAKGMSFESFAGEVGASKQTIYDWVDRRPEFAEAKRLAFDKCRVFWEKLMIAGAAGKIKNFNATMVIFNMKNRFKDEWRDVQRQEFTDPDGKPLAAQVILTLPDNGRDKINDRSSS